MHDAINNNGMEEAGEIVTLLDDNGEEVRFDHLLTFVYEGETYVALLPVDAVENVGDDEVLILRTVEDAEGELDRYLPVEDETKLDNLFEVFLERFDEMLDVEDEDE